MRSRCARRCGGSGRSDPSSGSAAVMLDIIRRGSARKPEKRKRRRSVRVYAPPPPNDPILLTTPLCSFLRALLGATLLCSLFRRRFLGCFLGHCLLYRNLLRRSRAPLRSRGLDGLGFGGASDRRASQRPGRDGGGAGAGGTTWTATARSTEGVFLLLFLRGLDRRRALLLLVVHVLGGIPQIVAVVLVGHPAAVVLLVVVVRRAAAPSPTVSEIIDVVVSISEPVLLAQLVTSRHACLQ